MNTWRFGTSALILALASAGCAEAPSDEELGTAQNSVLDGTKTSRGAYPAVGMVWSATSTPNIYDTGTGTLIGSRYLVTAAHVVSGQWGVFPPNVSVDFYTAAGKVNIPVETMFIHPSYLQAMKEPTLKKMWEGQSKEGVFDVALLILSQPPAGINPMPLSTAIPSVGTPVSFLGYGKIATGGALPVANDAHDLYRGTNSVAFLDQTYMTSVYTQGTSGTYSGDSGGPFMVGNSIVGVASTVTGYGYGAEDTFTRLGTIEPWLSGLMPGGAGMFAPDVYEGTEQTRTPFALNSLGHYSEPRSFTNAADLDRISFTLDRTSHVRLSSPHHFDWTVPFVTLSVTKDGSPVSLASPNASLYEGDLAAGTYVATVKNNYARGLSYTLGISTDGWFVQADPYEPDTTSAKQVAWERIMHHSIMPVNDEDLMWFNVSETSNVRIETLPLSGNPNNDRSADTIVTLLDEGFDVLEVNDDRPNSYCSLIERRLDPGNYYLQVGGYQGKQLGYYGLRLTTY